MTSQPYLQIWHIEMHVCIEFVAILICYGNIP